LEYAKACVLLIGEGVQGEKTVDDGCSGLRAQSGDDLGRVLSVLPASQF
jgi:hypothetical protein